MKTTATIIAAVLVAAILLTGCSSSSKDNVIGPQAPPSLDENLGGQAMFTQTDFDQNPGLAARFAPPWDPFTGQTIVEVPWSGIEGRPNYLQFYFDQNYGNDHLVYSRVYVLNAKTEKWSSFSLTGKSSRYDGFLTEVNQADIPPDMLGVGDNYVATYFCPRITGVSYNGGYRGAYACGCSDTSLESCGKWNLQRLTINPTPACGDNRCSVGEDPWSCPNDCLSGPANPDDNFTTVDPINENDYCVMYNGFSCSDVKIENVDNGNHFYVNVINNFGQKVTVNGFAAQDSTSETKCAFPQGSLSADIESGSQWGFSASCTPEFTALPQTKNVYFTVNYTLAGDNTQYSTWGFARVTTNDTSGTSPLERDTVLFSMDDDQTVYKLKEGETQTITTGGDSEEITAIGIEAPLDPRDNNGRVKLLVSGQLIPSMSKTGMTTFTGQDGKEHKIIVLDLLYAPWSQQEPNFIDFDIQTPQGVTKGLLHTGESTEITTGKDTATVQLLGVRYNSEAIVGIYVNKADGTGVFPKGSWGTFMFETGTGTTNYGGASFTVNDIFMSGARDEVQGQNACFGSSTLIKQTMKSIREQQYSQILRENVTCENGCSNGACINPTRVSVIDYTATVTRADISNGYLDKNVKVGDTITGTITFAEDAAVHVKQWDTQDELYDWYHLYALPNAVSATVNQVTYSTLDDIYGSPVMYLQTMKGSMNGLFIDSAIRGNDMQRSVSLQLRTSVNGKVDVDLSTDDLKQIYISADKNVDGVTHEDMIVGEITSFKERNVVQVYQLGDVNLDGKVDIIDAQQISAYLTGKVQLTDAQKNGADVNADGNITQADADIIAAYTVNLIDRLPWTTDLPGDGSISTELKDGETKTYVIDGKQFEVSVLAIGKNENGTSSVKLLVNGAATDFITTGTSQGRGALVVTIKSISTDFGTVALSLRPCATGDVCGGLYIPGVLFIDTLKEGETKNYTANGKPYETTVISVTAYPSATAAKFLINGQASKSLGVGDSAMVGDTAITVIAIYSDQNSGNSWVEFGLGDCLAGHHLDETTQTCVLGICPEGQEYNAQTGLCKYTEACTDLKTSVQLNGVELALINISIPDRTVTFMYDGAVISATFDGTTLTGVLTIRGKDIPIVVNTTKPMVCIKSATENMLVGDVNFDGKVDVIDAQQISAYLNGNVPFTDAQRKTADVNLDKHVTKIDADIIAAYTVNKISKIPWTDPLPNEDGSITDTIAEGETKTYTMDNKLFEVTVVAAGIDESNTASVKLLVNGQASSFLNTGATEAEAGALTATIDTITSDGQVQLTLKLCTEVCVRPWTPIPGLQVSDTLKVGETKTYTVNGEQLETTVVYVSEREQTTPTTKLLINGQATKSLAAGDSDQLGNIKVLITSIYNDKKTNQNETHYWVEFGLINTTNDSGVVFVNKTVNETNGFTGDVTLDGVVDVKDAQQIARYVAGLTTFTDAQKALADVNSDGIITQKDADIVSAYSVGNINKLPWTSTQPLPS